jgi:hypothetical protein
MTTVDDPSLGMEPSESGVCGGTVHFMAPELLYPPMFGLDRYMPSKEADIHAMAITIYQVRTTRCSIHAHTPILPV